MKISIIIPTHNRAESLKNAMESVLRLKGEADFEFVIVDNNSTDATRRVVESYATVAKYVFEGNTSFTMARKAGADHSSGDVLLYLDDDVLVREGSLKGIIDVFSRYADCGVIAGRIDPQYLEEPPRWAIECQKTFNGWSLFNPETIPGLREDFQEVPYAAGPMMAIRRTAYDRVGGFPPDTIGVETNRGKRLFSKLYIGPGDYGLCVKIRRAGFRVYYSSAIAVFHVIPPVRFTVGFWRSRVIGEGYHLAITQRGFFRLGAVRAYLARLRWQFIFLRAERKLLAILPRNGGSPVSGYSTGMRPEELFVLYAKAYLDMDFVLRRYPDLWKFLWEIGSTGVSDSSYDDVVRRLPQEYRELVGSDLVYDARPIDSPAAYCRVVGERGYYRSNLSFPFGNLITRSIVMGLVDFLRALRARFRARPQP